MIQWMIVCIFTFFLSGVTQAAQVLRLDIRGTIDPATAQYLIRGIGEAQQKQMSLILVHLDTPGGLVSSTREMTQAIDQSTVPVAVYVGPAGASATSAGALLMLSAHVAAMAPGTNIGAAHPVGSGGAEIEGASGEKAVNDVSAFARGLAELRGRPVDLASQMVAKSASLTAEEALQKKLVEIMAPTERDLLKAIDGRNLKVGSQQIEMKGLAESDVIPLEMKFGELVLHYLSHPNVAAILMSLGLLLIYAELSSPGIGIPGIAGALCLMIAFIAFQAIPVREGAAVLVALGAALIVAEFFVTSGGLLALGGVVFFLLGLLWLVDPAETNLRIAPSIIGGSTLILGSGVALLVFALSRTKLLSTQAMTETGGTGAMGLQGYEGEVLTVESSGTQGTLLIRGERWQFEGHETVSVGDRVVVTDQSRFKLKIKKTQTSTRSNR